MSLFTRETLPSLLAGINGQEAQVYLLHGERFLCQEAAEQLEKRLLQAGGRVHAIDGDQENFSQTLAHLRSYSLFPGRQLYRVADSRLFHSKQVAKGLWERAVKAKTADNDVAAARSLRALLDAGGVQAGADAAFLEELSGQEWQRLFGFAKPAGDLSWTRSCIIPAGPADSPAAATDPGEALIEALARGLPPTNVLMLLSEEVDKRKKLYKLLKEEQVVVDLSVESGSGSRAQKEQKTVLQQLVVSTLQEGGKSMAPAVADLLFERVGFHPVAVVMELRKVMLYCGERPQIARDDLDAVVGRTRQEALFELTGALSANDLEQALVIGERLQENGIHPLAIVATLRNHVRGLLLLRALIDRPGFPFQPAMSAAAFQQQCLPLLKEQEVWKKELSLHPFALFMQCKTASRYSLPTLGRWMKQLLEAEFRLKGSALPPPIVLHHLLHAMLIEAGRPAAR